ncbi:MAG: sulfite exporter TauE/SafE family protein [Oscillospiraceae bacterium]
MLIMGLGLAGVFPALRKFQLHLPEFLTKKAGTAAARTTSPLVVGLLNGLMPCGPLQSMQLVALASGNPAAGALSMLLFGLGTVPLQFGLGAVVSALGRKFTAAVTNAGAVMVTVLGLAMLAQGASLAGLFSTKLLTAAVAAGCAAGLVSALSFKKTAWKSLSMTVAACAVIALFVIPRGTSSNVTPTKLHIVDGKQLVVSTLSAGTYPDITVEAGTPVSWTITAPAGSLNGCNSRVNIPAFGISGYAFATGENTLTFTPEKTGKFEYSCWMGMIHGTITVVEASAQATAGTTTAAPQTASQTQTDPAVVPATEESPCCA